MSATTKDWIKCPDCGTTSVQREVNEQLRGRNETLCAALFSMIEEERKRLEGPDVTALVLAPPVEEGGTRFVIEFPAMTGQYLHRR